MHYFQSYSAFTGSGFCPVPGHVILTCNLHISFLMIDSKPVTAMSQIMCNFCSLIMVFPDISYFI